jgi:uncharacterized protein (DUF1697 family)
VPVHIALLRAVNVGGHGVVAMSDLRALFAGLGFDDVRTLLQSGNVVFRSSGRSTAAVEKRLEMEAEKRLGLRTAFLVRSAKEWDAMIAGNPFRNEAERDPGHLVIMCLKDAPEAAAVAALQAAIKGPEVVRAGSRHVYLVYPDGIGPSRLTIKVIEGKLGTQGTARNWNTVRKLAALARG